MTGVLPTDGTPNPWLIDAELRPMGYPHIASVAVGDHLLLAHEGCDRPVVLDAVSSVIWGFLDGATSIADIAADMADALGGSMERNRSRLESLLIELGGGAFISSIQPGNPPTTRRVNPPIDPASCLGTRLGIDRGLLWQVEVEGRAVVRFGATESDLVSEIAEALPADAIVVAPDDQWVQTLWARLTSGRRPRVQSISNALGEWAFSTTDLGLARETLMRSVVGLIEAERGVSAVWAQCPAMLGPSGVTLLHPAVGAAALGPWRGLLESAGVRFAPSTVLRLRMGEDGLLATLPSTTVGAPEPGAVPVVGVVLPPGAGDEALMIQTADLLRRWDSKHLSMVPTLIDLVKRLSPDGSDEDHIDALGAMARGASTSVRPASLLRSGAAERHAERIVARLGRPHDVERSVKTGPGLYLPNRLLLSFDTRQVAVDLRGLVTLLDPAGGPLLPLPPDASADLASAPWIHLGFEESRSGLLCKLHLEVQRPSADAALGAEVVHRSFKWMQGSSELMRASYVRLPLGDEPALHRLAAMHLGGSASLRAKAVLDVLDLAQRRVQLDRMMALDVREEGNLRRSVDINIGAARLSLAEMLEPLGPVFGRYDCVESIKGLAAASGTAMASHISTGLGRSGEDFLTVYYRDDT